MAKVQGHDVVRLPPYHCDFNAIELIWAQIKADVAKHNLSFKSGNVKTLFETAVSKVTMENWKSACDHVKSVEKFYWEKDGLVDEVVDRLCINLEDSDNDEEEEDRSEEGNSATALSSSNIPGICPLPPSP
ncbi:hypothetical protein C0J52_13606 [Blattella germanica]|nr:hypothetical protein C0J52_13606 [Blattella germanica]